MATSNEEIVDALTRSSAAMAESNNSLTDTISLEAASIEVVRNAETVGQAYKTIAMRLQGLDEETGEVSDDLVDLHGKLADLTKTAKTPGGISIYTNAETKELKSTKQLLTDIHDIYDDLNEKQKAEVRELIGGKRGGQVVGSLLRNWEAVEKATKVMENSAGSANREVGIASDSIEFKLNELKETWVGILQAMSDRGGLGMIIEGLSTISSLIKGIADVTGGLPIATAIGGGVLSGTKGVGIWEALRRNNVTDFSSEELALDSTTKTGAMGKILIKPEQLNLMKQYNAALRAGGDEYKNFVAENEAALNGLNNVAVASEKTGYNWQQYTDKTKLAALGTKALSVAMNTLISFGIGMGISLLISGIERLANASKYAEEELDNMVSKMNEMSSATKKSQEWIDNSAEEFVELSKGVDGFGRNLSLTDEEYKTYLSLSNEAADLFPNMISYWDEMGNKIVKATDGINSFNKEQEIANQKMRANLANNANKMYSKYMQGEYEDSAGDTQKRIYSTATLMRLQQLLGGKHRISVAGNTDGEGFEGDIQPIYDDLEEAQKEIVKNALQKIGDADFTLEELQNADSKAANILITAMQRAADGIEYDLDFSEEGQAVKQHMIAKIQTGFSYGSLNDDEKALADQSMSILTPTFIASLKTKNQDPEEWVSKNIIQPLKDGIDSDDFPSLIDALFKVKKSDFNSLGEYIAYIENIIKQMLGKGVGEDVVNKYLELAGLSEDYGKVGGYRGAAQVKMDAAYSKFAHIDGGKKYLDSLTEEEITALNGMNTQQASALKTVEQLETQLRILMPTVEETTKSFDELWNSADDKDQDAKDELLDLAKAGKLTKKAFENNDFGRKLMSESGETADQLILKINKLIDDTKHLAQMKTGISGILDIYDKKKEAKDNRVGGDDLKNLGETLEVDKWEGPDVKIWERFKKVAGQTKYTLKDLKKAQDDLATSFVNTNAFLDNLTEDNKGYYQDLLTEMGVTNAASVVTEAYATKMLKLDSSKADACASSDALINATADERDELAKEAIEAYGTSEALGNYIIQVALASGSALKTDASISNLIALAKQCGATVEAIQLVQKAQTLSQSINAKYNAKISKAKSSGSYQEANALQNAKNAENNQVQADTAREIEALNKIKITTKKGSIEGKKPGSPSGNPNKDKSSQNKTKQFIDWIERRMTRINNIIGNIQAKIENIGKWTFGKKVKLSNSSDMKNVEKINKQLDKEIKYYKTLYKVQKAARTKYQDKADSIAKKNKKVLTKSVIRKIQSGKYNSNSFKKWYQGLSDKNKGIVDQYIEFYDKGKSANQGMKESVQKAREANIDKATRYQDLYDKRVSRAETKEGYYVGADRKNKFVDIQLDNLKKSYEQQKEIAKLNGDYVEYERLTYELKTKQRELLYHEIENIKEDYEIMRGVNNRRIQDAENLLSVAEAQGRRVNTGWYTSKNINERDNIKKYEKERDKILKKIDEGIIVKGSKEWDQAMNDLQETENGVAESTKNIAANNKQIQETLDKVYDEIRSNNQRMADKVQFIADMSREENINTKDRGTDDYYRFTSSGIMKFVAAQAQITASEDSMNRDMKQYNQVAGYRKLLSGMTDEERQAWIKSQGKSFIYNSYEEIVEAEEKYQKQWEADYKTRYEAQNKMIDLVKEYYESQKQYLSEIIDARKKILDEEKDLYDYEKNINEKTKNIATLQKRLSALQGDNSEAGKARRQQIQTQLDQAREDLRDTEYERWKSDQESMLQNLSDQYNDIVDNHLKEPEKLLSEASEILQTNQPKITGYLEDFARDLPTWFSDVTAAIQTLDFSGVIKQINKDQEDYLAGQSKERNNAGSTAKGANPESQYGKSPDEGESSSNGKGISLKNVSAEQASKEANAMSVIQDYQKYQEIKSDAKKNGGLVGTAPSLDSAKGTWTYHIYQWLQQNSTYKKGTSALNKKLIGLFGLGLTKKTAPKLIDYINHNAGANLKFHEEDWSSEDGQLYQWLKARAIPGFKTGGIGRLVKASGEDGFAMVRNGEGFVKPEHVDAVQQWMNNAPDMTQMLNMINKNGTGGDTTIGDMYFTLPNVTDPRSFIETFQNSKEMQRLFKVSFEDLSKNGSFSHRINSI